MIQNIGNTLVFGVRLKEIHDLGIERVIVEMTVVLIPSFSDRESKASLSMCEQGCEARDEIRTYLNGGIGDMAYSDSGHTITIRD